MGSSDCWHSRAKLHKLQIFGVVLRGCVAGAQSIVNSTIK